MEWYYAKDGVQHGPVELNELRRLLRERQLSGNDKVWNPAFGGEWRDARDVAELSGFMMRPLAAPPPTPPAGQTPGAVAGGAAGAVNGDTANRELMRLARERLRGNWAIPVLGVFLWGIVTQFAGVIPCLGVLVILCVMGAMEFGFARLFLGLARGAQPRFESLFEGFACFGNTLAAFAWMSTFIALWSLLLIVPGIVACFSYAMTYYIMADNPRMPALEAIGRSKAMMRGCRWKLFCLYCRFFGWSLLALLFTLGIGMLWVTAYMRAATANFYESVKTRA